MSETQILRIWHKVKHSDYTVTEIPGIPLTIHKMCERGGFWSSGRFIPWHSVSYVEISKSEEPRP